MVSKLVLHLQPSYFSRVRNADVLERAQVRTLSSRLTESQLLLFGKAGRAGPGDPLHDCLFTNSGLQLRHVTGTRPRGRPRMTWAREVYTLALETCSGDVDVLVDLIHDDKRWRAAVQEYLGVSR